MLDTSVLYTLSLCALIFVVARKWRKQTLQYPPGPKGYPILGNVLDLPKSVPIYETFVSLAERQGTDILYLHLLGKDTIVLCSNEAISDLIDKRSSIYADRPQTEMMKLSGLTEWSFTMMPYGERWKIHRKLCHEALNVRPTVDFDSHQYKYTHRLLAHLLEAPDRFMEEAALLPGAIILSVTYGIDVTSADDPFLTATLEGSRALAAAIVPGKFLVEVIPMLRYLPDWFPGTEFKALAKEARDKYKASNSGPMEYVKNAMKSGEGFSHSIVSDCLSRLEDHRGTDFSEEDIRDVAGNMFGAAAETTRSTLQTFFLAMVCNPKVMKKAQEELDRVVGKERLPDFSDKDNLPYIDALVKELLRWGTPVPLSVVNRAIQDDVYRGYFIPAGASVIQNVWAVLRDPKTYPDPEAFNPDRFLKDGKINPLVSNPELRVFGAGRRICPGRNLALKTLYLVISCVLSVFKIGPTTDDNGNPQVPEAEFRSFMIRDPKPFKCTIMPRSEVATKLVEEACSRTEC